MRATGLAASVFAAVVTLSGVSFAQSSGFALNRFDPSERGSDWFSTDSLDLRGASRLAVGLVGDWAHKPLVRYDQNGNEKDVMVENQLYAHLGASWVFFDRLRFGLNVPVVLMNTGSEVEDRGKDGFGIGDLRVGADARMLGEYGEVITVAFGVQVHIPVGSQDGFTSDGKVRIVPRLSAAGDFGVLAYSARVGVNVRTLTEDFENEPFGTELLFGAAAGARLLDGKLLVGPEIFGSTVVSDSDGLFARRTTPFEVIVGGHYSLGDNWRFGLAVGPGLTRGMGAPQLRVLASVEWCQAAEEEKPPSDRDGDGIFDENDACPDEPGVANEDRTKHGCPLHGDRDGDGIFDEDDACPDDPGVRSNDPKKHGCPRSDKDGDGIFDEEDACPEEAGPPNEDPEMHGCAVPPDRDDDGVYDDDDACPDDAGPPNEDPKKNGCPIVVVTETEIRITERVEFDTNTAKIRLESAVVLEGVLQILQRFPEIRKVRVEGHTDNRGVAYTNRILSRNRAAAVVKWLTDRGIESERLISEGYGQTRPIDPNNTDEARQNNRRVEFHIIERTPNQ